MIRKIYLTLGFLCISTTFFAQPEIYNSLHGLYYKDISFIRDILYQKKISKIIKKRGLIKEIYDFDTTKNIVTRTDKYLIKNSITKFYFQDSLVTHLEYEWLVREKNKTEINYFYKQCKDTLSTYAIHSPDTILIRKSYYENSSNLKTTFLYVMDEKGNYNQQITILSHFDTRNNKIKETLIDTTNTNDSFLEFEANYDNLNNIVSEKCLALYHKNKHYDLTIEYEYELNKRGDWIRKVYFRNDIAKQIEIKRKIEYY